MAADWGGLFAGPGGGDWEPTSLLLPTWRVLLRVRGAYRCDPLPARPLPMRRVKDTPPRVNQVAPSSPRIGAVAVANPVEGAEAAAELAGEAFRMASQAQVRGRLGPAATPEAPRGSC